MRRVAAVALLVGMLFSCTENNPPPQDKPVSILSPPVSSKPPSAQAKDSQRDAESKPSRSERARASRGAAPIKGAQFTIFCQRIEGAAHVERATRFKDELINKSGMDGWHLVHEDGQSLLYFGYYRTFNDPKDRKEATRAQNDLRRIKTLSSEGDVLFADAMFVDLQAPDPAAPPEWNLANANGVWSLQIAAYKDSPMRKEAAVEAVREARKQGIDAYFYHGQSVSSVCVGAWPEDAVRYVSPSPGRQVHKSLIVNQPMITGPDEQEADPAASKLSRDAQKVGAEVVQGKVEIVDLSLVAAMQKYPHHAVNGMQMTRSVNGQEVVDPSLLIRVPEPMAAGSTLTAGSQDYEPPAAQQAAEPQPLPGYEQEPQPAAKKQPPPAPQPGLGKLKSVGG